VCGVSCVCRPLALFSAIAHSIPSSQPELGGNPVSLRALNRPLSGSMAFLGHLGLNTVQKSKGKAKNPLNGARQ
jgi:hypothetical protein